MIITDPNQIDLTGADKRYKRNLRRFKVFAPNQLIELEDSAYLSTFHVYKITGFDDSNEPIKVELVTGNTPQTYTVDETCRDYTAEAKAKSRNGYNPPTYSLTEDTTFNSGKNYYTKNGGIYEIASVVSGNAIPANTYYEMTQNTWNFELINKFYMNDTELSLSTGGEYEIGIEYQGLELECSAISQDGIGPDYSPGLMRSLINKVEELYYVRNPIDDVTAVSIDDIHCLNEDLTGRNVENYITGELHTINTANKLFVIRPQCGSFYNTNSLKLIFKANSSNPTTTELVKDIDYVVTGLNKEKTAISEPTCGVYEYIVLKRSFVGLVYVSYQAFGGEVTQADINTIKSVLQNVYRVVSATDIVTASNISSVEIIRNLITRQDILDHSIGHYQAQVFSYETSTSDKWANIAFIDKHPWSSDAPVSTVGIGEFRIKIPDMYFFMNLKVAFDLNAPNESEILNISVYHQETPSFDKNGIDYFAKRIVPKFRLIWTDDVDKGIMLQMSITSQSSTVVNVTIEDCTGVKSPWYLIDTLGASRPSGYTNTSVDYGDRTDIVAGTTSTPQYEFMWRSGDGQQSNAVALYPQGYTVFAGNIPIEEIELVSVNYDDPEFGDLPINSDGYTIEPIITGSDIDLNQVKSVEFVVFDRLTQKYLIGRSQKINCQNNTLSAEALYFIDDLCLISCTLEHTSSNYVMKFFTRTGTNSLLSHRFDLVRVDLIN